MIKVTKVNGTRMLYNKNRIKSVEAAESQGSILWIGGAVAYGVHIRESLDDIMTQCKLTTIGADNASR